MIKTVTYYYIVNANGKFIGKNYSEDEKDALMERFNRGIKRGWNWEIKSFERTIGRPVEDWELAGCKQDSRKVDWGRNWMKDY